MFVKYVAILTTAWFRLIVSTVALVITQSTNEASRMSRVKCSA